MQISCGQAFQYIRSILSPIRRHTSMTFQIHFIIPRMRPASNAGNLSFCIWPFFQRAPECPDTLRLNWKTTDVKIHPKVPSNHDEGDPRKPHSKRCRVNSGPSVTPHGTRAWFYLLQLHPLPSHFSPSTIIASPAQDKQQ